MNDLHKTRGCDDPFPFSQNTLLKGLIYKALRSIPTLSELAFELYLNPSLRPMMGLSLYRSGPSVERFSHFLRSTDNQMLQSIRQQLVLTLIQDEVIGGSNIALDSCSIPVMVKQNNLKTSVKDRFDKTQILLGDPQARLGVIIHFPNPFQKKSLTSGDTETMWSPTPIANCPCGKSPDPPMSVKTVWLSIS